MNRHGFVSIYALLLLSVFLGFATVFTQQIITFSMVIQPREHAFMDIYLTHMAKTYLKERLQHEDEEIAETTPADTEDTSLETREDSTPNVIEKRTASYQGCDITMEEQDEDTLAINYSCGEGYKQVKITYEPKEKYIISFEYL